MGDFSPELQDVTHWPFLPALTRLGLAVAIGVFVGLEREHSGKAGVRTFALTSLLGSAAGMSGGFYPIASLSFTALIVALLNGRHLMMRTKMATTTSMGLILVAVCGILCGEGHVFTPVATALITAGLLAWKQPISGFVGGLTDQEVRSAILLGILTFIIYPILPSHPVDPWGLVEPQSNWASVIIIAAIGFVNYILMKWLGPRGMEITAFFGGLVNSRKVVVELTGRRRSVDSVLASSVYRGVMLATGCNGLKEWIDCSDLRFASSRSVRFTSDLDAFGEYLTLGTPSAFVQIRRASLPFFGVTFSVVGCSKIRTGLPLPQCCRRFSATQFWCRQLLFRQHRRRSAIERLFNRFRGDADQSPRNQCNDGCQRSRLIEPNQYPDQYSLDAEHHQRSGVLPEA
jgi:hypothetical protein